MNSKDPYSNLSRALRRGSEAHRAREAPATSRLGRLLKTIFYALIFAFALGLLIGTLIRREMEKPVRYIGALPAPPAGAYVDPLG